MAMMISINNSFHDSKESVPEFIIKNLYEI